MKHKYYQQKVLRSSNLRDKYSHTLNGNQTIWHPSMQHQHMAKPILKIFPLAQGVQTPDLHLKHQMSKHPLMVNGKQLKGIQTIIKALDY